MKTSTVVVLANSPKEQARCVAGIDLEAGRLVRPIAEGRHAIPELWTVIDGKPLQPLDVVRIPFRRGDATVPFQRENRYCTEGWERAGRISPQQLLKHAESERRVLITPDDQPITERVMKRSCTSRSSWKSLQLLSPRRVEFEPQDGKIYGRFRLADGREHRLRVTDDRYHTRKPDHPARRFMLLTSLTPPWRHYLASPKHPRKCYKLIAGLIPTG